MAGRDSLGARRKAVGLTQESLAELLRVERSTVPMGTGHRHATAVVPAPPC
jgi:hypothetical protein